MIISLIAAMTENRIIGLGNRLPWHLPQDMKRFRELTLGRTVIMGRRTYESIGRPLPERRNIVVTSRRGCCAEGCRAAPDLATAFGLCEGPEEVFVLGGARLFRDTIAIADRIYLTVVHAKLAGDALFPEIPGEFRLVEQRSVQDAFPLEFLRYERMTKGITEKLP
ncbi:MAG: dihydrofolate reductase [Nitrospirota bacterium]|nr:dihydrofolate reductase [Nitrospirota bacterium]